MANNFSIQSAESLCSKGPIAIFQIFQICSGEIKFKKDQVATALLVAGSSLTF